jgi:prevent-host-death family protein
MLHVDLDNILTHDELGSKVEEVLRKADDEGKILVVTRNGRPAVAILKLEELEKLSGHAVSPNTPATTVDAPSMDSHMGMEPHVDAAPTPSTPPVQPLMHPAEVASNMSAASPTMPDPSGLPDMPEDL